VHYIDTTEAQAEELLLAMSRHLPPRLIDFGRLSIVTDRYVFAVSGETPSLFRLEEDGGVSRIAELPGGLAEVARWVDGQEVARSLVRRDVDFPDPDQPGA
jgi:hypothetical protein